MSLCVHQWKGRAITARTSPPVFSLLSTPLMSSPSLASSFPFRNRIPVLPLPNCSPNKYGCRSREVLNAAHRRNSAVHAHEYLTYNVPTWTRVSPCLATAALLGSFSIQPCHGQLGRGIYVSGRGRLVAFYSLTDWVPALHRPPPA